MSVSDDVDARPLDEVDAYVALGAAEDPAHRPVDVIGTHLQHRAPAHEGGVGNGDGFEEAELFGMAHPQSSPSENADSRSCFE